MAEFDNKVVIVTGGAQGIGRGICLGFAEEGASVVCADVNEETGRQTAAASGNLEGEIRFERADVAESDQCRALVDSVLSRWGRVDVLCNNVGIQRPESYKPAHELPDEMWDRIIDVNLKSCFLMSKCCIPVMREQGGGVIVNTASVQGLQSMKGVSAYAASKGGMLSLTRQLALEYAEDNIRVLAVNPGTIDTPLVDDAVNFSGGNKEELVKKWSEAHPVGHIGKPADIANAFLFLASDRASFITGEYLCVDGGMMAQGSWA